MNTNEEPVRLVPYDPAWPQRFADERALLTGVLAPWLEGGIEHIGSTAIPDLLAKPMIDIMAGVRTLTGSTDARSALAQVGYLYFPYRANVMHWFCKPSPQRRTHHLHLVPHGSRLWQERLTFRDYLRAQPHIAREYADLKTQLAAQYEFDREAYTEVKSEFVQRVLRLAQPIQPRRATEADIPALVRLINRAYRIEEFFIIGDRTDEADVRSRMAAPDSLFLVIDDEEPNRLAGSVYIKVRGERGFFALLSVDPDRQKRGLGRLLVGSVEQYCRAAGCRYLDLDTVNVRAELPGFYHALGFAAVGVAPFPEPTKLKSAAHLVLMSKPL